MLYPDMGLELSKLSEHMASSMQKPSLLGLQRPPRPAAEVAAAASARVRAWAAERCDEDVDALLLEAAQQVQCMHRVV